MATLVGSATMEPTDWPRPAEDERLVLYKQQMGDMFQVFEKSRSARNQLQEEYDRRNQQVLDKLASVQEWTEQQARERLTQMQDFSAEFADLVGQGKHRWRGQLAKDRGELDERIAAPTAAAAALDEAIRQEHEDCNAHTAAETGAIDEQLRLLRKDLERQVSDREREHGEFCAEVQEHFDQLRHRLKKEGEARKQQCSESLTEARGRYTRMDEQIQRYGDNVHTSFDKLRERMRCERAEHVAAQETIARNLASFLEAFERSLAEAQAKQVALEAHLTNMTVRVREEAS